VDQCENEGRDTQDGGSCDEQPLKHLGQHSSFEPRPYDGRGVVIL
jgi:hypothetical protein